MSRRKTTDPRTLRGAIAGPGGAHDLGAVVLDTSRAVLLGAVNVCSVDGRDDAVAMLLSGRINRSTDHADVLFLMDSDGLAAILTEVVALMGRAGDPRAAELRRLIGERFTALDRQGLAMPADGQAPGGGR